MRHVLRPLYRTSLPLLAAALLVGTGCDDATQDLPPVFVGLPAEVSALAGEAVSLVVSARDPEGTDVSLSMLSGPEDATFVVSGFGRFDWQPTASDASPAGRRHDVVFRATDGAGGTAAYRLSVVVFSSEGGIRFVTSNARVLVLERTDTLITDVAVQADGRTSVSFELSGAPAGMALHTTGPKSAELRWRPTDAQVAKSLVWTAAITAGADEPDGAEQLLTITLVPAKGCDAGGPQLAHVPLGEQRVAGHYPIDVTVEGAGASPVVTLYWRQGGDPDRSGGFEGVPLSPTAGSGFAGLLPNPDAAPGAPTDLYYFIVAGAESAAELGCLARTPAAGFHHVTAFAAGDASCRQDRYEPNDAIADAAAPADSDDGVSVLGDSWDIYGLSLCPDDPSDVFEIALAPGENVVAAVSADAGGGAELALSLRSPDGVDLASAVGVASDGQLAVTLSTPAAGGTYFVEVLDLARATPTAVGYDLSLLIVPPTGDACSPDGFEANDSLDAPAAIPLGTGLTLSICPGDVDVFEVDVPAGSALQVEAGFIHADGDLDLYLFDEAFALVARADSQTNDESLTWFNDGAARSVVLEVSPYTGGAVFSGWVPYTLYASVDDAPDVGCLPDALEPNDDSGEALEASSWPPTSLTMCGDDDVFAVALGAGDTLHATTTVPDGSTLDLDVDVRDPAGQIVAYALTESGNEAVSWQATDSGRYTVRVHRYGDGAGEYLFEAAVEPAHGACPVDANEPNDDLDAAADLQGGAALQGLTLCPGDTDAFRAEVNASQQLFVEVATTEAADSGGVAGDVILELVAPGGAVLTTGEYLDGDGTLNAGYLAADAGTVYVRVVHLGLKTVPYDLSVYLY